MFFQALQQTFSGVVQLLILGAIGFILARKKLFAANDLHFLSRLVVEITLPVMIFHQLVTEFSFQKYPDWWIFPLISLGVNLAGLAVGLMFLRSVSERRKRLQFLALNIFQNSGYLPLGLTAALVPEGLRNTVLVYLFLFLLGFNLLVWSFGRYMLSLGGAEPKRFELGSFFSPPVIAILLSLFFVFTGISGYLPKEILGPMNMVGNCTVPLALIITGANLAAIEVKKADFKAMFGLIAGRMVLLPLLGLIFIVRLDLPSMVGLLVIMQLAVPPATSLSVIISHSKRPDLLISQGIFFGHLASLVSIPLFLSLYFMLYMIK